MERGRKEKTLCLNYKSLKLRSFDYQSDCELRQATLNSHCINKHGLGRKRSFLFFSHVLSRLFEIQMVTVY